MLVGLRQATLRRGFGTSRQLYNNQSTKLTWDQFLALRLRRRKVNVVTSCGTAALGVGAGWAAIANIEIDPTQMIMGFDPFFVYAAGLIACGGLGYLCGPSLGDVIFQRLIISKQAQQFAAKNGEFLRHIKINRPDPRKQSYGNPVTDFYGEKIGSLKDYRQWLRDGKAYKRKSEKFL